MFTFKTTNLFPHNYRYDRCKCPLQLNTTIMRLYITKQVPVLDAKMMTEPMTLHCRIFCWILRWFDVLLWMASTKYAPVNLHYWNWLSMTNVEVLVGLPYPSISHNPHSFLTPSLSLVKSEVSFHPLGVESLNKHEREKALFREDCHFPC